MICPNAPCPAAFPTGFGALTGTAVPAGTYYTPAACSATVTTCNFAIANPWSWFSQGNSSYNALQVDVNHRFSKGLSLRGAYTWSRAIDDGDSVNSTTANNAPALTSNPFNLAADKGLATYNAKHVAVISAVYQLPFGRGRATANNMAGWSDWIVGGWSVNSIVTVQSGLPFTPQLGYNPSRNGDTKNPVRPFLNPAFTGNVDTSGTVAKWFDPTAFIAPPNNSGFYGNAGRDTLIGPGLTTWDFSLMKGMPDTRETDFAISSGNVQCFKSREFQHAKSDCRGINSTTRRQHNDLDSPADEPDRGTDHQYFDYFTPDSIGLKLLW